jgi:glycosyltransferase involved in cell wall biosynthesis
MYNGERYLRACIDSILAQTCTDFELILVDDCSTDKSGSIAESYRNADGRVRVVRNPTNLGLVGNWNRSIDLANGEWIKFVFQDDTIEPNCLSRMLDAAGDSVSFVASQRTLIFETGTDTVIRNWYLAHKKLVSELFAGSPFLSAERCQRLALDYFGLNVFGEPTAVLIRRSAFEKVGRFDPTLVMNCDFEMWMRIAIHFGAAMVDENLATFRVHGGSATAANLADRAFRSRVLDSLIILHHYVYDETYEPVRREAARGVPPVDLERVFSWRCHEARWEAHAANRKGDGRDPRLLTQWKEVAKGYPTIARTDSAHLLWRASQRIFHRPEPPITSNPKRVL